MSNTCSSNVQQRLIGIVLLRLIELWEDGKLPHAKKKDMEDAFVERAQMMQQSLCREDVEKCQTGKQLYESFYLPLKRKGVARLF
jgi:hypothetical protein